MKVYPFTCLYFPLVTEEILPLLIFNLREASPIELKLILSSGQNIFIFLFSLQFLNIVFEASDGNLPKLWCF